MEQMRGKWASSCVDFSYTELFCIPELTSEFISSCNSVLGDSLLFYQEYRGYLRVYLGIRYCSPRNAGQSILISRRGYVSWYFSSCGANLGFILELERGWPFETPLCSEKSGLLSSNEGHLRNLN